MSTKQVPTYTLLYTGCRDGVRERRFGDAGAVRTVLLDEKSVNYLCKFLTQRPIARFAHAVQSFLHTKAAASQSPLLTEASREN
jgi:hypothetical protein